tara:strand:+ start:4746 stop:4991 length:246 start_codon:yes stop_codon:yes gene_type:complete
MLHYLAWLEAVRAPEELHGAPFVVFASDGVPCESANYLDAVRVAMEHDKEIYDATAVAVMQNNRGQTGGPVATEPQTNSNE